MVSGLIVFFLLLSQPGNTSLLTEKIDTLHTREWIHLDPMDDDIAGVSLNKAYQLLDGRLSNTVLVAVIDSGFDLDHEDLKDKYWINEDEIPNNGIDDDKNGYIDDIHGWNFIGGPEENVIYDTYELTREFNRLKPEYENEENGSGKEYEYWLKIRDEFESSRAKSEETLAKYSEIISNIPRYYMLLQSYLDVDTLSFEIINSIESKDSIINKAKAQIGKLLNYLGGDVSSETMIKALSNSEEHYLFEVEYGYNIDFDPRPLVNDNYQDKKERFYGNNRVFDYSGMMGDHGTHVAGIIAADRDNNIGARGVADNVKIIALRTVPNGDERDKDVANAIYYAVDNGARVINMSFGKSYSPERTIVEKAIRYAEKKGALIVQRHNR
jgi:subtilisin family serine protease